MSIVLNRQLIAAVKSKAEEGKQFLCELISQPTVFGNEAPALNTIIERFSSIDRLKVKDVAMPQNIVLDSEYKQFTVPTLALDIEQGRKPDYNINRNVVLALGGSGGGRNLILNTHMDVVDVDRENWSKEMTKILGNGNHLPFIPYQRDNLIYGRGACDAKGQIAMMYMAFAALHDIGYKPKGNITGQIVIEEEPGGNGTLALIRKGYKADGAIVLEPTNLRFHHTNRGAVHFRIIVKGTPMHMGQSYRAINAVREMNKVIDSLDKYQDKLISESTEVPYFIAEKMVQVNYGIIHGGTHPSTVCGEVELRGGVGFLPNKSIKNIKEELEEYVRNSSDWVRDQEHCQIYWDGLANESYSITTKDPIVKTMQEVMRSFNSDATLSGWEVSCDARLFHHQANTPPIVFGAGKLEQAHSDTEHIDFNNVIKGANILAHFMMHYCDKTVKG